MEYKQWQINKWLSKLSQPHFKINVKKLQTNLISFILSLKIFFFVYKNDR
jgi:hypothetical protein